LRVSVVAHRLNVTTCDHFNWHAFIGSDAQHIGGSVCCKLGACRFSRARSVRNWRWRSNLQLRGYRGRAAVFRDERGQMPSTCIRNQPDGASARLS